MFLHVKALGLTENNPCGLDETPIPFYRLLSREQSYQPPFQSVPNR